MQRLSLIILQSGAHPPQGVVLPGHFAAGALGNAVLHRPVHSQDQALLLFFQMGQNQFLIVNIQHIRRAHRVKHQSAAPGQGL